VLVYRDLYHSTLRMHGCVDSAAALVTRVRHIVDIVRTFPPLLTYGTVGSLWYALGGELNVECGFSNGHNLYTLSFLNSTVTIQETIMNVFLTF
jgi:hypothetical protein